MCGQRSWERNVALGCSLSLSLLLAIRLASPSHPACLCLLGCLPSTLRRREEPNTMAVSTAEFAAGSCVQLLTPEERAQAIEAFEDGDTDGTGKLDIDLLLETLVAAGHFVPEEHSGTILQLGDVDKNGDLDLNEFLELVGFLRSIAIAFQVRALHQLPNRDGDRWLTQAISITCRSRLWWR